MNPHTNLESGPVRPVNYAVDWNLEVHGILDSEAKGEESLRRFIIVIDGPTCIIIVTFHPDCTKVTNGLGWQFGIEHHSAMPQKYSGDCFSNVGFQALPVGTLMSRMWLCGPGLNNGLPCLCHHCSAQSSEGVTDAWKIRMQEARGKSWQDF